MYSLHTITISTPAHHRNRFMVTDALDHIHVHGWVFCSSDQLPQFYYKIIERACYIERIHV